MMRFCDCEAEWGSAAADMGKRNGPLRTAGRYRGSAEVEIGLLRTGGGDRLGRQSEVHHAPHLCEPPAGALQAVRPNVAIFIANLLSHSELQLLFAIHIAHS